VKVNQKRPSGPLFHALLIGTNMPKLTGGRVGSGDGSISFKPGTDTTATRNNSKDARNNLSDTPDTGASSQSQNQKLRVVGRNLGIGSAIFAGSNGADQVVLDFKTLVTGAGVEFQTSTNSITITSTATGGEITNSSQEIVNVCGNAVDYDLSAEDFQDNKQFRVFSTSDVGVFILHSDTEMSPGTVPLGAHAEFSWSGEFGVTFESTSNVVINSKGALSIARRHGVVMLTKVGDDEWELTGDVLLDGSTPAEARNPCNLPPPPPIEFTVLPVSRNAMYELGDSYNTFGGQLWPTELTNRELAGFTYMGIGGEFAGVVGVQANTLYGSITINSDGSYLYRIDDTNPIISTFLSGQELQETIRFTARNADASGTASFIITIGTTRQPQPSCSEFNFNLVPSTNGTVPAAGYQVFELGLGIYDPQVANFVSDQGLLIKTNDAPVSAYHAEGPPTSGTGITMRGRFSVTDGSTQQANMLWKVDMDGVLFVLTMQGSMNGGPSIRAHRISTSYGGVGINDQHYGAARFYTNADIVVRLTPNSILVTADGEEVINATGLPPINMQAGRNEVIIVSEWSSQELTVHNLQVVADSCPVIPLMEAQDDAVTYLVRGGSETVAGNVFTNDLVDPTTTVYSVKWVNPNGGVSETKYPMYESGMSAVVRGAYGTLGLSRYGIFEYTPYDNNVFLDNLFQGTQLTETFQYTVSNEGVTPTLSTARIMVTLQGNGAPPVNNGSGPFTMPPVGTEAGIIPHPVNMLGVANMTAVVSEDLDDESVGIQLPFPVQFMGVTYTSVFVGSNSYLTFGNGSTAYRDLRASHPSIPGIHIGAYDNSYQAVYAGSEGNGSYFRIRYEGSQDTSLAADRIFWEVTFYRDNNRAIAIECGSNRTNGTSGVTTGAVYAYQLGLGVVNQGYMLLT
jgi:VCBS repeat-containing protein